MKTLLSLLLVFATLQPLSLQACDMADMDAGQQTMNHTAMGHDMAEQPTSHDCCDTDEGSVDPGCNDAMQCGSCPLTLSAIPALAGDYLAAHTGLLLNSDVGTQTASFSSPPFRPPIS